MKIIENCHDHLFINLDCKLKVIFARSCFAHDRSTILKDNEPLAEDFYLHVGLLIEPLYVVQDRTSQI